METASACKSSEDEQKVIVKFLITLDKNKRNNVIHKQLARVYKDEVIPLSKVAKWCSEIKNLRTEKKKRIDKICLHKADDPWRRNDNSNVDNEHLTTELILRYILRTLNKITEENFAVHLERINSFPIKTEDCLRKVVSLFLSHVCVDHKYSNIYAKLCSHLYSKFVPYEKQIIGACPMYLTFGELIRSGCEEDLKCRLKQTESELYESSFPSRYKLKGLTLFIAELYMLNVLPIEIAHDEYLGLIFDDVDKNLFKIECACISLFRIGKYLELQTKTEPPKFQKEKLDSYFLKLKKILDTVPIKIPLYLYFMVLGVIELRDRDWRTKPEVIEYPRNRKFFHRRHHHHHHQYPEKEISTNNEPAPTFILKKNNGEEKKVEWKIRGLMNKMTESNHKSLIEQILALPLKLYLPNIVSLIVKKAVREPLFSNLYAELCHQLCISKTLSNDNNEQGENNANISFKELLINECDKIWNCAINNDSIDMDAEAWYEYKILSKGIGKFFTELYKLGILSNDTINQYILFLFTESKQTPINLEFLCNFLTYIGEHLEKENVDNIEKYFSNIKALYEKIPKFPNRILFMFLDLLELRERKWLPRNPIQQIEDVKIKIHDNPNRKKRTRKPNIVMSPRKPNAPNSNGKQSRIFSRGPRFLNRTKNDSQESESKSDIDHNSIEIFDLPCTTSDSKSTDIVLNDNVIDKSK